MMGDPKADAGTLRHRIEGVDVAAGAANVGRARAQLRAARKLHNLRRQHELASRRTSPLYRDIRHLASPVKPASAGLSAWRVARHTKMCFAGSRMTSVIFPPGREARKRREDFYAYRSTVLFQSRAVLPPTFGSVTLPTAPRRSVPWRTPKTSRKNERKPVRPYSMGIAASSYLAG